jgi:hypothetical protein
VALVGRGVLAIWNGIADEAEADFVAWHVREHIPERVAVPGFLRGRRYVAEEGLPKYFNFYEVEAPETLTSPAYLERLNAPSDWTRRVVRHFQDTSRTVCKVSWSRGVGDGGFVASLRLEANPGAGVDLVRVIEATVAEPAMREPGIVAVHLLEGLPDAGGQTAEKALRDRPDEQAAWILLVEATDRACLDRVLAGPASAGALAAAGVGSAAAGRGIYRLQYALARGDLR